MAAIVGQTVGVGKTGSPCSNASQNNATASRKTTAMPTIRPHRRAGASADFDLLVRVCLPLRWARLFLADRLLFLDIVERYNLLDLCETKSADKYTMIGNIFQSQLYPKRRKRSRDFQSREWNDTVYSNAERASSDAASLTLNRHLGMPTPRTQSWPDCSRDFQSRTRMEQYSLF